MRLWFPGFFTYQFFRNIPFFFFFALSLYSIFFSRVTTFLRFVFYWFLNISCSVSLCFFLFFKNFHAFCFYLEDFLMSFVIEGLNCLCGFNLTFIFGKHVFYKERKIPRSLLYTSLTFCKILILFQSILRNFCLYLSIDWSEVFTFKMYCFGYHRNHSKLKH